MKAVKILILVRILLLSLWLLGASEAAALNDISVRLYDQKKILAGNYSSFCNDRDGFLWIGTDAGLIRFDGNYADLYRNDELNPHSISDNKIVSLYTDSKGRTWVGTVDGLNMYDDTTDSFRLAKLPGKLLNGYIRDIVEFPDGRLLFIASGVGIYLIDKNSIEEEDADIKVSPFNLSFDDGSGISRMINNDSKDVFFTTVAGSVCRLNPDNSVERLAYIGANVSKICWQPDETLVLSSQYEVFRLDLKSKSLTPLKVTGNKKIKVTEVCSSDDVTYIATGGDGLWEVKHGNTNIERADRLTSSNIDLSSLKIGSVFKDRLGSLWLGCNNKGLAMAPAHKGPFFMRSLAKILREEGGAELTSMCVVGSDIAVGLNNGKVILIDNEGEVRKVVVSQGAPVTSLSKYTDGRLLVGLAREGIWSVDTKSLALTKIICPASLYPGVVVSGCDNGDIVAAFGELGVLRYKPDTRDEKWFYPVGGSNLLSCGYYSGISNTSDGRIWIGGYSGIACYDPETDNLVPIDQSPFVKGVVNDVCDVPGGVMIATDRGLLQYSLGKGIMKKFTVLEGLPDNDVRTLENDGNGGIWIGTMKGIAHLIGADGKIRSYGGMSGISMTSYVFSGHRVSPSEILFGNFESLVMFDPGSVSRKSFGSNVYITGLYVNGQRLPGASRAGSSMMLEGPVAHPETIHLSHRDNSLVVRLSTLDFRDPSDLAYEWQFEGEGETWHSSSPGESVIYLPPLESGHHKLRLRGCENDMVSDVTEMNLNVKAPWYLSNMAYASYIFLLVIMAALIYKVVKNKREEELYETKIKYFIDISHELRSPVTLMLSPVETLLKQNHSPETTSQLLTMRRNGQRVLNLVDQLLDLRKIEKGKMRLVYSNTDIKAFVEELVEMLKPMAEEKKQTLSFLCQEKEIWGKVDGNNLDKILVNLISNAIKYTPDGGEVTVELKLSVDSLGAQMYSVIVTDTGIGLDNKVLSHLFERFYRNREYHHGNASGFGIGLDLCMRLVELHKGEINAKNREDGIKGSVFSVTLPLIPADGIDKKDKNESQHRPLPIVMPAPTSITKPHKSGQRLRIMVVDDDKELREYIKECLGASYKVVTFPDAESALKEISEKLPDLIVSDIKMGAIDGISFLRRLKTNMITQHIPVILFSSLSGSDERVKGWKNGADGYLPKPFSIEELEGMISGLLSTRNKLKGKYSGSQAVVDNIVAPKVKGVDADLMEKVNRYINDNISETAMNVDGLSEYVGLSRSQLHRRMKEIVGVAPSDYIRNVKLKKACEMLSQGDVDIAQVAFALGFNAQSHFSTLFKRYTGKTPSEYRSMEKEGADSSLSGTNRNI